MALAGAIVAASFAQAQGAEVERLKIGVMTDFTGAAASASGQGSVVAAKMAVADFGKQLLPGVDIEIVQADFSDKPDVASSIARKWLDSDGVNVIVDMPVSSATLAVNDVVRQQGKAALVVSGGGTTDITGKECSPNTVQWTYDTWSVGHSTVKALTASGSKKWFLITADFAFGTSLEAEAIAEIKADGGEVVGTVRHPFNNQDFSSYLLKAQSSGASVIGLANSVTDTVNTIKQSREFGIAQGGQKLAALIMMISDVHSLGLDAAQGLYLTEPFYWNLNDGTRAFSARFAKEMGGAEPTMIQAGVYAGLLHYMKAVAASKTLDGKTVIAKMKEIPTDDALFGKGMVRPDGRTIHDMYLFQVKTPAESSGPWDYYNLKKVIPAKDAFRPLSEGGCPLVK